MPRKPLPIIFITLAMLLQTSPAPLHALSLGSAGLLKVTVPTGINPFLPVTQVDLNGNNDPESLTLTNGHLSILSDSESLWQTPQDWYIVQAIPGDLNRDGKLEVTLLLWRPFRPWPVDMWLPNGGRIADFHNAEGQSCHIILIGWLRGGIHEVWAGSAMANPITSVAVADLNGDNSQELVTLEGRYSDPVTSPKPFESSTHAHALKVWEWNGFGFTVVSSIEGTFDQITLVQADNGRILILVP